jgi:hypothetical protein
MDVLCIVDLLGWGLTRFWDEREKRGEGLYMFIHMTRTSNAKQHSHERTHPIKTPRKCANTHKQQKLAHRHTTRTHQPPVLRAAVGFLAGSPLYPTSAFFFACCVVLWAVVMFGWSGVGGGGGGG